MESLSNWNTSKMTKYGNKKITIDGITFDSKKEGRRYQELKLLERAGEIFHLELQPRYDFHHNGVNLGFYKADFKYVENGELVVEDVKSEITKKHPVYRLKKKMMKAFYGIEIKEV